MAVYEYTVRVRVNGFDHQEHDEAAVKRLTSAEIQKYVASHIRDAVKSWGGQFYPGDLLFSGITQVTARPWGIELSKAERAIEATIIEDRSSKKPKQKVGKKNVSNQKLRKGSVHLR